jgi:hypothetical protein
VIEAKGIASVGVYVSQGAFDSRNALYILLDMVGLFSLLGLREGGF